MTTTWGGKDNYAVDRKAAAEVEKHYPTVSIMARTNRDFMHRSVRWLAAAAGIDQFLDVGTGIPTEPNLHQIAQEINPDTRVVYVDNDPIVLAHAHALLTSGNGRTAYIDADVRHVHDILDAPQLRETLDLWQRLAELAVGYTDLAFEVSAGLRNVPALTYPGLAKSAGATEIV